MKIYFFVFFLILTIFSCSQNKQKEMAANDFDNAPLTYDTVAIDSFSNGAVSIDIAERIKESSFAYQDSMKKVKMKQDSVQKIQELKEKITAEEKKKEEALDKAKKKPEETAENATNTPSVNDATK